MFNIHNDVVSFIKDYKVLQFFNFLATMLHYEQEIELFVRNVALITLAYIFRHGNDNAEEGKLVNWQTLIACSIQGR